MHRYPMVILDLKDAIDIQSQIFIDNYISQTTDNKVYVGGTVGYYW